MNIFKKCNDMLGTFIYGDIEAKLDRILEEIENDKNRTENLEKELLRSRKQIDEYKTFIVSIGENIPDMMWAKDITGKYSYANNSILNGLFYGTNYRNVIGHTDVELAKICKDLVGPENHTFGEICGNSDAVVLKNLKKERFLEWGLIDGKDLYLEVYKSPLYGEDGSVVGTVGTGRDVTEWYLAIKNSIIKQSESNDKFTCDVSDLILKELNKYKFDG